MKNKKNKVIFIPGLSEHAKNYPFLSKYTNIYDIDWNVADLPKGKYDIVIGFSLGAVLACEYSLKHKVKKLILCSLTPCTESLKDVQAEDVTFLVGEKEKWCLKEIKRVAKTLNCKKEIIVVPRADHKITGNYRKKLLEVLDGN
jgi:esterase/lipase